MRVACFLGCLLAFAGCALPPREPEARTPRMPSVGAASKETEDAAVEARVLGEVLGLASANKKEAAVARLATIPDAAVRARVAEQAVHELAARDLAVAGAFSASLPAGPTQTLCLRLVAETWSAREFSTALEWAAALPEPTARAAALGRMVESGVDRDPRELLRRIGALASDAARDEARLAAAAAWARRDADAALDWLGAQDDELRLRPSVLFAIAETRPKQASSLVSRLPEGRDRRLLVAAIAQTWVAQDRAAALAWTGALAAGPERDAAYAGIETGLGVPAARRRSGAPGQRTIRSRGMGGAGDLALRADFPEFAAWLATQPPGRDREEALLEFVRQRGPADSGAIGQWLASLPGGPSRDLAWELYLEGRAATAPAATAAWLGQLPRSEVSDAMVEQLARRWLATNPEAAATWLRDTPLPDFQKERLLREAGR